MIFDKLVVLDSVIFYPEHRERLESIAQTIVEYNTCSHANEVRERCLGADGIIRCCVDISRRVIDENPILKDVAKAPHKFIDRVIAYPGTPLHGQYLVSGYRIAEWPIGHWAFVDPEATRVYAALVARIAQDHDITFDDAEAFFLSRVNDGDSVIAHRAHAARYLPVQAQHREAERR